MPFALNRRGCNRLRQQQHNQLIVVHYFSFHLYRAPLRLRVAPFCGCQVLYSGESFFVPVTYVLCWAPVDQVSHQADVRHERYSKKHAML